MHTIRLCPQCHTPLPADAPLGLCPRCLIEQGAEATSPPHAPTRRVAGSEPVSWHDTALAGPRRFGDYELLEEIARGGMGVVWKARQLSLNRVVAVKMILSGRLAAEAEVRRFRTEAEAAAKLQHPNIVAIHEVGEHEGQHFFSMDFVEGQSLAELVFHRPLPPETAAKYLQAIAEAIHYAHQKGVLHRDLKPSNVLIDHAGQPRVTDFGLAKLAETDSGLTHTGAVLGSPSYMSPEQAAGRTREIGPATDVYALGAILYELITGRPPFSAATPLDTMRMVVESEAAAPRWVNPVVPAELETICLKCLEKDPRRRYASARDLADDLRRFLRHEPITARPATRRYRAQKWIKRRPAHAALAGVCGLALLGVVAGLWRSSITQQKHTAELNERLHVTLIEQVRGERLLGRREASLQRIAEAAAIRRTPELQAEAIQTLAQPGVRSVFQAPFGSIATCRLSADGRRLAVGGDTYVRPDWPGFDSNAWQTLVRVWDTTSSNLLCEVPWHLDSGPFAFSPDARRLAVPQLTDGTGAELVVWDVATGRTEARLAAAGFPWFSADGVRLAVQESNRVSVWMAGPRGFQLEAASDFAAAILAWAGPDELLVQKFSTNENYRLAWWNVASGRLTFPLPDGGFRRDRDGSLRPTGSGYGPDTVEVCAISGDGRVALTRRVRAKTPGELSVLDLGTGRILARLEIPGPLPSPLLLSHDGHRLVLPDPQEPDRVRVFDVTRGKFLLSVGEAGTALVSAFERFGHGPQAFSYGRSSFGNLVLNHTNYPIQTVFSTTARRSVPWVAATRNLDPSGSLLAAQAGVGDRKLSFWELESGRHMTAVPRAARPVWAADGRWLVMQTRGWLTVHYGAGSFRQSSADVAEVWEVLPGATTHRLPATVRALAFATDGRQLAVNMEPSGTVLWEVETSRAGSRLRAATNQLQDSEVLFNPNATWVLNDRNYNFSGALAMVRRFDATNRSRPLEGKAWVLGRGLAPDGRHLLLACNSSSWETNPPAKGRHLQLWDLDQLRRVAVWELPAEPDSSTSMRPLVFSPDGRRVALACFSSSAFQVWDVTRGRRLHDFRRPPPTYVPPPSQGFLVRWLRRFGLLPPRGTHMVLAHSYREHAVSGLAFTPDSRLVVSCAEDRAVIREVESGRELAQCRASTNVLCLAISPDGRTLATGDEDHFIRLWELPAGRELARWPAHEAAVTALAFSPDGTALVSGARDATLKLWDLPFLRTELKKLGLDW